MQLGWLEIDLLSLTAATIGRMPSWQARLLRTRRLNGRQFVSSFYSASRKG